MKTKWTKAEWKYLTKPSSATQRDDDWIIWTLIAVASLAGAFYLFFKVVIDMLITIGRL